MFSTEIRSGLRRRRTRRAADQKGAYIELVDLSGPRSHTHNKQWKSSDKPIKLPKVSFIFPSITMFASIVGLTMLALPILATPVPVVSRADCSTGSIQCCQSTESASSAMDTALFESMEVVLQDLNVPLDLDCSPVSVIRAGSGSACDTSPVCCEINDDGGLTYIGCVSITL
ncbi:hypothetical protein BDY19DRAFT_995020 [Irpex rosettiformis]|uniref:Uncharacterized protein n=1 Tax=Irpex rosettiformis TaxID=378272 RepID=A0ACB8TZ82_9APHY|nr:hypothetical protein BDY19DRAFT_995020 [Irpex rosettiformis]